MNVVVLGRGSKAGAWQIRGAQLGAAIGASRVINGGLRGAPLDGVDLIIIVKRPLPEDMQRIRASGIPVVWDIVDSWPQPIGNWWVREAALHWLRGEVKRMSPKGLVAPTQAMARDLAKFDLPTLVLPHHARPQIARNPVRDKIQIVGYEGSLVHLGSWAETATQICRKRGWAFRTNPGSLAELDVVIALREYDGYPAKFWKSNVKLANAQGSGTPCILNREAGYQETASGGELWADNPQELETALDLLAAENGLRLERSNQLHAAAIQLKDVAARYKEWLHAL